MPFRMNFMSDKLSFYLYFMPNNFGAGHQRITPDKKPMLNLTNAFLLSNAITNLFYILFINKNIRYFICKQISHSYVVRK